MSRLSNLLKLIPALAALGISLTVACASAGAAPPAPKKGGKPIAFNTVIQRSVPGQTGGEVRTIARDPDTWKAVWTLLRQNGGDSLPPDPPAVNFPREMALVVAMPTQSCVAQVTIQSIGHLGSPTNGTLLVTLLEAPPAPNCKCIVASRPIHVVRLPRTGGTLRFVVNHGQTACGGSPASPPH
jgi:hypothetical protein